VSFPGNHVSAPLGFVFIGVAFVRGQARRTKKSRGFVGRPRHSRHPRQGFFVYHRGWAAESFAATPPPRRPARACGSCASGGGEDKTPDAQARNNFGCHILNGWLFSLGKCSINSSKIELPRRTPRGAIQLVSPKSIIGYRQQGRSTLPGLSLWAARPQLRCAAG